MQNLRETFFQTKLKKHTYKVLKTLQETKIGE